jgi:hypothetical protein
MRLGALRRESERGDRFKVWWCLLLHLRPILHSVYMAIYVLWRQERRCYWFGHQLILKENDILARVLSLGLTTLEKIEGKQFVY